MNPDGLSFLEMGMAFFDGEHAELVNGHWSPAYPFLLGLVEHLAAPDLEHRFALAQWVNVLAFAAAMFAFHHFLTALLARRRDGAQLPDVAWLLLGYGFFTWSTFHTITLEVVTPDLFVSAFVYFAVGEILRVGSGRDGTGRFVLLGAVLGLGYLMKAPLLPLAVVFLAVAAVVTGRGRGSWPRATWGFVPIAYIRTRHTGTFMGIFLPAADRRSPRPRSRWPGCRSS